MFLRNSRYYPALGFEADDTGTILFNGVLPNETDLATGHIEHRAAQGERLEQLAWHYYGDGRRWWRIADANPHILLSGDLLDDAMIGERILIPTSKEI